MTRLQLRPYQEDALTAIAKAEAEGVRRQLLVAATGLGKTVIFAHLAERRQGRTLVIAHRDELVSQAAAKMAAQWPELGITRACAQLLSEAKEADVRALAAQAPIRQTGVGIIKAGADDTGATVAVASIQTLARVKRLDRLLTALDGSEPLDLVVVDEAHHARADTYSATLAALHAGDDAGPLLVGVTATPDRGDGQGLDDLFDAIVANFDILWGIRAGFLCDVRGLRVVVEHMDLSRVRVQRGDYDQGQAGQAMEDAGAPEQIVRAWIEHAAGRRTLVFTPTVAVAHAVADEFNASGIHAAAIDASTPLDERRRALGAYARGELEVLSNCAVLTEGYDEPRTDCIVVARPTKSRALYAQMIGRGTRRHPDKADLLVLDVVGATRMHSLITVPSLMGLDPDDRWASLMETGAGGLSDVMQDHDDELVRLGRLRAEEADLFRQLSSSAIAIVWVPVASPDPELRRYARPMGAGEPSVILAQRAPGDIWTAGLLYPSGQKEALLALRPLIECQGVAEDFIRQSSRRVLAVADAPWRQKAPSQKQKLLAKALGVAVPKGCTMGELSDLIAVAQLETPGWRSQ